MRPLPISVAVVILALSPVALAQGRFFLGATGGVSRTSLSGDAPDKASYTSRTGFSVGLTGEYALTDDIRLCVQPMFARRGTGVAFDVGEEDPRDSLELTLDYVTTSVMARFMSPKGAWFVNGGLDCGFLLDASMRDVNAGGTVEVKEFVNGLDLMMILGAGAVVDVSPAFLTFEIRYSQGLLNIGANNGSATAAGMPVRFRSSGFQLLAGVLFPL